MTSWPGDPFGSGVIRIGVVAGGRPLGAGPPAMADATTKRAVEIEKDYGPLPEIEGQPMQLKQVLMNLLVNAHQAIEAALEARVAGARTPPPLALLGSGACESSTSIGT